MPLVSRRSAIVTLAAFAASCSLFTSNTVEGGRGPCPAGMAHVPVDGTPRGYCIDRYEASVVELRGREEVPHSPYEPVTNLKVKAVSRAGVIPQGYISKSEAEAACTAAKKRLCTATEWQTACRGRKPTKYPYGDEHKEGYCNDSGRAPLAALHPELPGDEVYASHEAMNDARINRAPNTVAPTGKFEHCKNGYGVFDMVGNLHEWTAEVNGARGVFRGGYYQDTHLNGDGCSYKTDAHGLTYHDYSTGFRCCADPR